MNVSLVLAFTCIVATLVAILREMICRRLRDATAAHSKPRIQKVDLLPNPCAAEFPEEFDNPPDDAVHDRHPAASGIEHICVLAPRQLANFSPAIVDREIIRQLFAIRPQDENTDKVRTSSFLQLRGINEAFEGITWESDTGLRVGRITNLEVLLDDCSVSRRHAEIRRTNNGWQIRDEGSTNGTFLNGMRLGPGQWPLKCRDIVRFGNVVVVVDVIGRHQIHRVNERPAGMPQLNLEDTPCFPTFACSHVGKHFNWHETNLQGAISHFHGKRISQRFTWPISEWEEESVVCLEDGSVLVNFHIDVTSNCMEFNMRFHIGVPQSDHSSKLT